MKPARLFAALAVTGPLLAGCMTETAKIPLPQPSGTFDIATDPACTGITLCRALTVRERKSLKTVFGDQLPYDAMRVRLTPMTLPFAPSARIRVTGPYIDVLHPGEWQEDYTVNIRTNGNLGHEAMHVYQYAVEGMNVQAHAVGLFLSSGFNYDNAYRVELLKPGAQYGDFNMEQKARVVEHYFIATEALARNVIVTPEGRANLCRYVRWAEGVLSPVLQGRANAACALKP